MKTLTDQLVQYAHYHRDRRNIATHLFGIPMIVFAIVILLSRPAFPLPGFEFEITPVWLVTAAAVLYYLVLDLRFGVLMGALLGLSIWAAQWFAAQATGVWLAWGLGLFIVGWIFQFVGHAYEGRKPAFVDDLVGLMIGPLFVVAEVAFTLGLCPTLQHEIEAQAGPTRGHKIATPNPNP